MVGALVAVIGGLAVPSLVAVPCAFAFGVALGRRRRFTVDVRTDATRIPRRSNANKLNPGGQ
jgi:hypothetical protein